MNRRPRPRRKTRSSAPPPLVEVDIHDLASDGRGVGRLPGGKALFVAGALPGDRVRVWIERQGKSFDAGVAVARLDDGPGRVPSPCAISEACGGCALIAWNPALQHAWKTERIGRALIHIARIESPPLEPLLAGEPLGYRTRADVRLRLHDGVAEVGFLASGTHRMVPLPPDGCAVLVPALNRLLDPLRELLPQLEGGIRLPKVRIESDGAGRCRAVFKTLEPLSRVDQTTLIAWGEGLNVGIALSSGEVFRPVAFADTVEGCVLSPPPGAFRQANQGLNPELVRLALDGLDLKSGDRVLEAFAGSGNLTLPLIARLARLGGGAVTAVDWVAPAVAQLAEAAQGLGEGVGLSAQPCDLEDGAAVAALWGQGPWDALLLDPPREGAKTLLTHLKDRPDRPGRVVMISCHPESMARDAAMLIEAGYRIDKVVPVDMFPMTPHVESVSVWQRVNP